MQSTIGFATQRRRKLFYAKKVSRKILGDTLYNAKSVAEVLDYIESHRSIIQSQLSTELGCIGSPDLDSDLAKEIVRKLRCDLFPIKDNYSTEEIINYVAYLLEDKEPDWASFIALEEWKSSYEKYLPFLAENLPKAMLKFIPFRESVLIQVAAELTGRMFFNKEYILKTYESSYQSKSYLVFPSNVNPKRLMVFFSGNVGRKTYNRYSWYWDESEVWESDSVYLFLNDVESHWYVGVEGKDDVHAYRKIILNVMNQYGLDPMNVYTIGGSMGGYGAIFYAANLGLRAAIAVHPQLCFRAALRYKEKSWEMKMRECGHNFQDLSNAICRFGHRPIIYLEHGNHPSDVCGLEDFLAAMRYSESTIILRKTKSDDHLTNNPSKRHIESLIRFFESFDFSQ